MWACRATGAGGLADHLSAGDLLSEADGQGVATQVAIDGDIAVGVLNLDVVTAEAATAIACPTVVSTAITGCCDGTGSAGDHVGTVGQGEIIASMTAVAGGTAVVVSASSTAAMIVAVAYRERGDVRAAKVAGQCSGT